MAFRDLGLEFFMPFRSQLELPLIRGSEFIPEEIDESLPCLVYRFDVKLGMIFDSCEIGLGRQNLALTTLAQQVWTDVDLGGYAFDILFYNR